MRDRHVAFTLIAGLLILAGCAPLTIYHREGVAVTRMETDALSCEISTLQAVPVANQLRRDPPRYIPARRYCDANGQCYTRGGYYIPGEVYTVDVNADLRRRAEVQCMADKGYTRVTVPNCPANISSKVPVGATEVLPRLSPRSCAIRNRDKTWQIVTRVR
ncbi:hypothetical protein [Roseobacter insulae]|nr:hypothetical protein [Roseobacter insulae]